MRRAVAVVWVAMVAALVGCVPLVSGGSSGEGEGPAYVIDWDLSGGHELSRVDWDRVVGAEEDLAILTGGVEVRVALPGGQVVEETFRRVQVHRDETHVLFVEGVFDRDLSLDEALVFAGELSERWDAPLDNFERWHEVASDQQARGAWVETTANTNGELLSERGPEPSFRTIRSGNDEKPVSIILAFSWRPEGMEY